ncbi:hypothetical protein, partial [Actinomadura sp. BRA 177]|uniref:hypothetical protein n=1 Tax=Actinomadura sp. BRA 177 TaxID=2745202 RepID=UPI001595C043
MPEAMPRRALLLGGGAALVLPWLAGCAAEAAPRPDVPLLVGAIAAEQELIAAYRAARAAGTVPASRLDPVLAHHRAHLAVLKRHYVPGSGDRAGEGGAMPPPSAPPPGPAGPPARPRLPDTADRAARARPAAAARSPVRPLYPTAAA